MSGKSWGFGQYEHFEFILNTNFHSSRKDPDLQYGIHFNQTHAFFHSMTHLHLLNHHGRIISISFTDLCIDPS